MRSLDNKVVVITGAGSGIGRALAVNIGGRGALLGLSDVNAEGLAETAELARAAGARQVETHHLDVADRDAFIAYAAEIAETFGRVNVVINNAGVAMAGDLTECSYDDIEWIMNINFWGVVHGTKEFLPHLIESGDGHIVNISSLFGLVSIPTQSAYNASKYAVRGLSEALRTEMLLAGHKVGVTVVHPGGIKTAIARNGRYAANEDGDATAAHFDQFLARTTPEDAASVIVKGILRNTPRVLVGADAHAMHTFAKITGARYQDAIALLGNKVHIGRQ